MMGWSAVTLVETLHSLGTVSATLMLTRLLGARATGGPGTSPAGVMYVTCAVVPTLPGFWMRTHVSKPPFVEPSARYHSVAGFGCGAPSATAASMSPYPVSLSQPADRKSTRLNSSHVS